MLRIGTWNTEWAGPGTARGQGIRVALADPGCDILCVTEGYAKILPRGGHVIDAGPDWGCPIVQGRRKVLLWSRRPWSDVDRVSSERPLSGRFVAGTTMTDAGRITVVGVCIPWSRAHVDTCGKDAKVFEEHMRWLAAFETLSYRDATEKTVVLGDFNQRIPRTRQPKHVYQALRSAMGEFAIATAGTLSGVTGLSIDHIAHTPNLTVMGGIGIWPAKSGYGKRLSDHFGVWCDFDDFGPSSASATGKPG